VIPTRARSDWIFWATRSYGAADRRLAVRELEGEAVRQARVGEELLRLGEVLLRADLLRERLGGASEPDRDEGGRPDRVAAHQALDDPVVVDGGLHRLPGGLLAEAAFMSPLFVSVMYM
jgi:hypothetical protein